MNNALSIPSQPIAADRKRATTSVPLLSHLRWAAAIVVVMSHVAENILNKGVYVASPDALQPGVVTKPLMGWGGYGHAAVVIFFVLSGFLVGGKLVELQGSPKLRAEWPGFLVDRFSRIFIVLWPVLLLTAAVMAALLWWVPDAPFVRTGDWTFDLEVPLSTDLSWLRWIGAALMLNDLAVRTLDGNAPLWSLAYEWCYYIIGLGAVLAVRRVFSPGALLVMLYGAVLIVLSLYNQPNVLFAGLSWLLGIAARVAFNAGVLRGRAAMVAGVAAVLGVLLLQGRLSLPDPVLAAAMSFMIAHPGWRNWRFGDAAGERLAGFSYTLYAMHFPVLLGIMGILFAAGVLPHRLPFGQFGIAVALGAFVVLMGTAWLFALVTEDQTVHLRRALLQRLGLRRDRPAPPQPAGAVGIHTAAQP